MTDKIIIDGVDVSGCEQHCSDNHNNPNMCYQDMTGGYLYCQPKERHCNFYITQIEQQLARKTEECEKLQECNKELHKCLVISEEGRKKSDEQWRQSCSEYNYELQAEKQKVKELEQWQEDAENILKEQLDNFDKIENRYKQALEEIKKEATYILKSAMWVGASDNPIKQILQKCEVLND